MPQGPMLAWLFLVVVHPAPSSSAHVSLTLLQPLEMLACVVPLPCVMFVKL